jgi:glycosyltransferase involved in cell wall biosynthesis
MSTSLVSVWCSTYNHEKYIARTIEGFLKQKTNFEIEIFVHDDASTDNTASIIREYAAKYPQIKPIYQTENKFSVDKSYLNKLMFQKTQGKYTALCEGDDYWTDAQKLQKQIDFLEANNDFAICFHNTKVIHEDGSREPSLFNINQKEVTTFDDLARGNYIMTPSCVYRNRLFGDFPDWFFKSKIGDWPLHLLNAQYGKIKYLDEVMAVYSVHGGGVWSLKDWKYRYIHTIEAAEICKKHFAPRGKENFNAFLTRLYRELCLSYFDEGAYRDFRKYYVKILKVANHLRPQAVARLTVYYLLSFLPPFAIYYKSKFEKSEKRSITFPASDR